MMELMQRRKRMLAVCLLGTTAIFMAAPQSAHAQAAVAASAPNLVSYAFNISSKSLAAAIAEVGAVSGWRIAYPFTLSPNQRSKPLSGSMTVPQAVSQLLAGTGYTLRISGRDSILLVDPKQATGGAEGGIKLDTIDVSGQAETAWGPVVGYVAKQSATGSKTDTPLVEVPQAVSVVTRDQMQQQDAQNLKQALRYTSGVASDTRSAFGGYDIMYSRGFVLDRFLDGLKVGGGAGYTVTQIEPYGLERLEVLHGPASVLYGASSPGGLVNAVSKRPLDTPLREVQVQTGNFDRLQGAFDFSGPVNPDKTLLYRITGLAREVDSQVDYTKEERYYIAPALTWRPNADTSLTVLATLQSDPHVGLYGLVPANGSVLQNPYGQIPRSRFLGDPNYNENSRDQASIGYIFEHRFDDVWQVRQNVRFTNTEGTVKQVLPLSLSANNYTLNRYALSDVESINNLAVDNQVQANFTTGPFAHTVLFGLDYQRVSDSERLGQALAPSINIFNPVYYQAITTPPTVSDTSQVMNQVGLYAQDQVKFDGFVFTVSGRQDWVNAETTNYLKSQVTSQDPEAATWRAGLNYVFDNGVAPYVSYATSFQPTLGTDINGNAFQPTTGQQYEAGIKYQPVGMNALFTAAVFNLTQQNVLTVDPTNTAFNQQTGEITSKGIELEGKASLGNGLDLLASYTYLHAEVTASNGTDLGKRPLNVPDQMASLWAFYTIQDGPLLGFGFGGGVRYVGETAGNTANTLMVPGYTLVDAALQYDFGKQWSRLSGLKFTLNASNLFDKTYVSECSNAVNCLYGTGRTVLAGMRYTW
ncbi:TonB-dependent siderophore receptor [Azorhizobium sp. AG788]|uniref:TonB-dependent siderophore receptor n=1 Tax=Azorhizobium sp. AG788 TaxID=2183897 RepID=UPI00313A434C